MASFTVHPSIRSLLSPFCVGIVLDTGMAVRAGETPVDRILKSGFGYKKRDGSSPGILLF
jgi:sugar phosphate isomerase/epimerase